MKLHTIYSTHNLTVSESPMSIWLGLEWPPFPRESKYDILAMFSLIRRQLKKCVTKCHPMGDEVYIPTRLIDVGCKHEEPRLLQRADLLDLVNNHSSKLRYAAMSYCWGSKEESLQQLETNSSNLRDRLRSIAFESLSAVVKDGIKATRMLGLRFLWIDALCIVQDDLADWELESASMGEIYQHAFVTLCASASSSCLEGFLKPRYPANTVSLQFQSKILSRLKGTYTLRDIGFFGDGPNEDTSYSGNISPIDIRPTPWSKRGWTFQEEQLSTRLLIFGSQRVHLLCSRRMWTEPNSEKEFYSQQEAGERFNRNNDGGSSVAIVFLKGSRILGKSNKLYDTMPLLRRSTLEYLKLPVNQLYTLWLQEVIPSYSQRQLTFRKDVFPAISSLAKFFAEAMHLSSQDYVAGVWKEILLPGLLWRHTDYPECRKDDLLRNLDSQNPYIAPSWSWASRPYPIAFHLLQGCTPENIRNYCEVESISSLVTTNSLDPFGAVTGGTLHISGRVKSIAAEVMPWTLPKEDSYIPLSCGHQSRLVDSLPVALRNIEHSHPCMGCIKMEIGRNCFIGTMGHHRLRMKDGDINYVVDWCTDFMEPDLSGDMLLLLLGSYYYDPPPEPQTHPECDPSSPRHVHTSNDSISVQVILSTDIRTLDEDKSIANFNYPWAPKKTFDHVVEAGSVETESGKKVSESSKCSAYTDSEVARLMDMPTKAKGKFLFQQADPSSTSAQVKLARKAITTETNQRGAMGLLLHPSKEENKYLRVGVWYSHVFEGNGLGLKFFDNAEIRSLVVI